MKQIGGLRWKPRWVSHLGCVKGCLDHLGVETSWAWLYGGTGHAFIINIHEVVCPSGPTAWNSQMLYRLAPNLGYTVNVVMAHKSDPEFGLKQEQAWAFVRACIDDNIACYGWGLDIEEYYTIHGYDEVGYYYSGPGCDRGAGPKPWQAVGDSAIGVLEMHSVKPCDSASEQTVVKEALAFALEHAETGRWTHPHCRSGPGGFDLWADALEQGRANRFGQGFNAAVWAECRREAVAFLEQAKGRLAGRADSLFDNAIAHYRAVSGRLEALVNLHPFVAPTESDEEARLQSPQGAMLMREAADAESKGLEAVRRLLNSI